MPDGPPFGRRQRAPNTVELHPIPKCAHAPIDGREDG
jgi:hypothetical protein